MADRPYVLLSAAMSADGYIDDARPERLIFSGAADADRVDELRAGCDAILVGAGTIRRDDPRLLVRSPQRQADRRARGLPSSPARVTLTLRGDLDPAARFFTAGDTPRLVYAPPAAAPAIRRRLGQAATVVELSDPGPDGCEPAASTSQLPLAAMLADLASRGIARLMVEGGSQVQAGFLGAGLADELRLAIAPFFVADRAAPRLAGGRWPAAATGSMRLAEVQPAGEMAVLRYLIAGRPARESPGAAGVADGE